MAKKKTQTIGTQDQASLAGVLRPVRLTVTSRGDGSEHGALGWEFGKGNACDTFEVCAWLVLRVGAFVSTEHYISWIGRPVADELVPFLRKLGYACEVVQGQRSSVEQELGPDAFFARSEDQYDEKMAAYQD